MSNHTFIHYHPWTQSCFDFGEEAMQNVLAIGCDFLVNQIEIFVVWETWSRTDAELAEGTSTAVLGVESENLSVFFYDEVTGSEI